jgi:Zn-dependent peptidase ImmA (M78 family)
MKMIEGPLHPVRLKIVGAKAVKKKAGKDAYGVYVPSENCVYLNKDQTAEQLLHTFVHEMVHAMEEQLAHHDKEDDRADIIATWLIRLFKPKSLEKVI